ncbi:MAG: HlyD family efflux transporter periplasmic adaptor subunit, partial [bacterium]|nr:HlyD family efflux transporter periplasmic adaptor subunit [bacterium]
QPVVRLIDPSVLKVEAYLTDQEVSWVKTGTTAEVMLQGQDQIVLGTVSWVALEADRMTGKFKMELEIPNLQGHLRSGVIGRAKIQKNVLAGVLSVPRDAVLISRNGESVFVVQQDRSFRKSVVLGAYQGGLVTVKQGLAVGDKVVVRGHRSLRDSSLVKVTEVSTRADGLLDTDPEVLREDYNAGGQTR